MQPSHVAFRRAAPVMVAGLLFALAGAARSDVKIIAQVQVTGLPKQGQDEPAAPAPPAPSAQRPAAGAGQPQNQPEPPPPVTVTTYYKGKFVRTEIQDGPVTIYDIAAGKVYTLHPDQKTYDVVSMKEAMQRQSALFGGNLPKGMEFNTNLSFDKANDKRNIAGTNAECYDTIASAKVDTGGQGASGRSGDSPAGGSTGGVGYPGGGRFPNGGGFPGDDNRTPNDPYATLPGRERPPHKGKPQKESGRDLPSLQMDGEYWLADASILPQGEKSLLWPLAQQTLPGGPMLQPLNDKLVKLKGIPLTSKTTMTIARPDSTSPEPIVTTMQVQSIALDGLDTALFKVPDDYKKVDPQSPKRQRH